MSTSADTAQALPRDFQWARTLRFTLGVTLTAAVAFALQWPLFYLAPVLTVFLLAHPSPGTPGQAALQLCYNLSAG